MLLWLQSNPCLCEITALILIRGLVWKLSSNYNSELVLGFGPLSGMVKVPEPHYKTSGARLEVFSVTCIIRQHRSRKLRLFLQTVSLKLLLTMKIPPNPPQCIPAGLKTVTDQLFLPSPHQLMTKLGIIHVDFNFQAHSVSMVKSRHMTLQPQKTSLAPQVHNIQRVAEPLLYKQTDAQLPWCYLCFTPAFCWPLRYCLFGLTEGCWSFCPK